jgi:hypothetical protein
MEDVAEVVLMPEALRTLVEMERKDTRAAQEGSTPAAAVVVVWVEQVFLRITVVDSVTLAVVDLDFNTP